MQWVVYMKNNGHSLLYTLFTLKLYTFFVQNSMRGVGQQIVNKQLHFAAMEG